MALNYGNPYLSFVVALEISLYVAVANRPAKIMVHPVRANFVPNVTRKRHMTFISRFRT